MRTAPGTCVIGAGSSGLPVVKTLKDRGLPVTCFERTPNVGGLRCIEKKACGASAAYDSLHINTDTRMTEHQDFPLPEELAAYPSHRQIHEAHRPHRTHQQYKPPFRWLAAGTFA